MRTFINDFIRTLSGRRQERVSDLLEVARVGKEQFEHIANRLEDARFTSVDLNRDDPEYKIQARVTAGNVTEIDEHTRQMFEVTNLVSTLLNSHTGVLGSRIKALEDELIAMEKMAMNYAFLMADNQAYDFGYLEPFTDERGRGRLERIPDRAGLPFGPAEMADIRPDEGVLVLPETKTVSHGMWAEIIKGNATSHAIENTGLENLFSSELVYGWKMRIASPGAINAPLPEDERSLPGAQVLLEFRFTKPSPASEIKLVPFANTPLDVLQVTVFDDYGDDSVSEDLLSSTHRLKRPLTLHFPLRVAARFRVLLNQPTFEYVAEFEKLNEHRYVELFEQIKKQRQALLQLQQSVERHNRTHEFRQNYTSLPTPTQNTTEVHNRLPPLLALLLRVRERRGGPGALGPWFDTWLDSRVAKYKIEILEQALEQSDVHLDEIWRNRLHNDITRLGLYFNSDGELLPTPQVVANPRGHNVIQSGHHHHYSLGLQRVTVGVEAGGYKAAFVSRAMDSSGDSGMVRLKTSEENYRAPNTSRHSPWLTSVEYSVTNRSDPVHEVDWLPILPVGVNSVTAERLFINSFGVGRFRFPALATEVLRVYLNGYRINLLSDQYIYEDGFIVGLKNILGFSVDDFFTVDYVPAGDYTTISFEQQGFDRVPLVSAHSADGVGERFLSAADRNTVTLQNMPYIDQDAAQQPGYHPITVQLASGTVAENLTDYQHRKSVPLPPDGYYYIHSGNTIMFNRPITEPFRVFYQYLQNNVRVRVVLRTNSNEFVSPTVDYFHLKAKNRQPNVKMF